MISHGVVWVPESRGPRARATFGALLAATLLLVAAGLFIDLQYFEKKAQN